jgi:O-antigen ligase
LNRRTSVTAVVAWQSRLIWLALALTPVLVLRSAAEPFQLPKATFVLLLAVAMGVLLIARFLEEGRVHVTRTVFLPAFALYIISAVVVTATSSAPRISVWGEYRYFVGSALLIGIAVLVFALLLDPGAAQYRTVAYAAAAGAIPVVLYAVLQTLGADPFEWTGDVSGVFSTMAGPNFLAGYLVVVFPIVLALAFMPANPAWLRVATGILALMTALMVLPTASFQGPVGIAAGAVLPLGLLLRRRLGAMRACVAGLGLLIAAGATIVLLRGRLMAEIADGLRERTMMWKAALNIFREEPIVGSGLSTYGIVFTPNRPPEHAQFGFVNPEQAHNVALNHLAEGGLVLFIPWMITVAVVAYLLVSGLRRHEGERQLLLAGFGGAWLAYQAQALVSIDMPMTVLLHWLAAAVIAGLAAPGGDRWIWVTPKMKKASRLRAIGRGAATIGALGLVWFIIMPLRADIAALSGFRAVNSGEARTGLERIESATTLAPSRATYWLLLASARETQGDDRGALEALETAASLDAGSSSQALAAGRFADRTGDLERATAWYEEALARDPFNVEVLERTANYLNSIGEFERENQLRVRVDELQRTRAAFP